MHSINICWTLCDVWGPATPSRDTTSTRIGKVNGDLDQNFRGRRGGSHCPDNVPPWDLVSPHYVSPRSAPQVGGVPVVRLSPWRSSGQSPRQSPWQLARRRAKPEIPKSGLATPRVHRVPHRSRRGSGSVGMSPGQQKLCCGVYSVVCTAWCVGVTTQRTPASPAAGSCGWCGEKE